MTLSRDEWIVFVRKSAAPHETWKREKRKKKNQLVKFKICCGECVQTNQIVHSTYPSLAIDDVIDNDMILDLRPRSYGSATELKSMMLIPPLSDKLFIDSLRLEYFSRFFSRFDLLECGNVQAKWENLLISVFVVVFLVFGERNKA